MVSVRFWRVVSGVMASSKMCIRDSLWALEKNERALAFYRRHGFAPTGKREFEEGTTEYIVELKKKELTVNQFVQNGNRHL